MQPYIDELPFFKKMSVGKILFHQILKDKNKIIDTFNTSHFTILASIYLKLIPDTKIP